VTNHFKPEMFFGIESRVCPGLEAADIANRELEKLMKDAKTVYAQQTAGGGFFSWRQYPNEYNTPLEAATHTAKLMFIEKLPEKKCEHRVGMNSVYEFECLNCGKKLKPNWQVIE